MSENDKLREIYNYQLKDKLEELTGMVKMWKREQSKQRRKILDMNNVCDEHFDLDSIFTDIQWCKEDIANLRREIAELE